MVERKFNMFTTKEWLQFLQYKLSPEREKELTDRTYHDPFLREAVETISNQENRPIAFQSLSFLINQIEDITGVSESKIMTRRGGPKKGVQIDRKWLVLVLGLVLLTAVGYGIYWFVQNPMDLDETEEINAADMEPIHTEGDSSSRPFDVIPSTTPLLDTTSNRTLSIETTDKKLPSVSGPRSSRKASDAHLSNTGLSPTQESSAKVVTTTGAPVPTKSGASQNNNPVINIENNSSKEREMFNQAQEMYKQGNKEGAKQILNNLKSYDNPMKAKSEQILESLGKGN